MPSLDVQIVLIYILIRIHGNVAGIAVFLIALYFADGIAVMHQTIDLVVMICFIISAVYLYSFFAGQFNERLGGVFGFGPFGLIIRFLRATCAIAFMRMRTTIYNAVTVLVLLMHALMVSVAVAITVFILMLMVCPHGVKDSILSYCYAISTLIFCGRSILSGAPALKGIVFFGGFYSAYLKGGTLALFYLLCFRRGWICAAVGIISEGNLLETLRIIAQIQGERVRRISGMRRSWSSPCSGGCAHISLIYVGG